jgi:hypothetical protein
VREKVLADVIVVDSRDAALEVIRTTIPDVLLLSALLSPRDEDELIGHLRTLDAQHLQTHTIPQLASSLTPGEGRSGGGLLSAFRRKKKEPEVAPGCDPDLFAEEIRTYLKRAEDKKRERLNAVHPAPDMRLGRSKPQQAAAPAAEASAEEMTESSSSWSSPFEWKPSGSSSSARRAPTTPHYEPPAETPAPAVERVQEAASVEPLIRPAAAETEPAHVESILAEAEPALTGREALIPEPGVPKTMSLIAHPESVIVTADDPEDAAIRVDEPASILRDDPVVVMREPSVLMSQPVSVLVRDTPSMEIEDAIGDDAFPEITLVEDPVDIEERSAAPYAADLTDAAAETLINLDAATDDEPVLETPRADGGFNFLDPGFTEGIQDRGFAISDQGSAIRGVGPLASWARSEKRTGDALSTSDDLRMLLAGLAVPASIAGVRYARGVRIRRVRVPASQATDGGDTSGPVILSRRALAEQREQTGA